MQIRTWNKQICPMLLTLYQGVHFLFNGFRICLNSLFNVSLCVIFPKIKGKIPYLDAILFKGIFLLAIPLCNIRQQQPGRESFKFLLLFWQKILHMLQNHYRTIYKKSSFIFSQHFEEKRCSGSLLRNNLLSCTSLTMCKQLCSAPLELC